MYFEVFNVQYNNNFTCKNVLPSSRNKRNGTSKSTELRNSDHLLADRYCDPDTAHIGALIPVKQLKYIQ